MASTKQLHHYPQNLNPFGDEEEEDQDENEVQNMENSLAKTSIDDYPDFLSPFGDEVGTQPDDYDNSLNPFEEEEDEESNIRTDSDILDNKVEGNPFEEEEEEEDEEEISEKADVLRIEPVIVDKSPQVNSQPTLLEPPPVPLPRTKSLLKKELAEKNRQQLKLAAEADSQQPISPSTTTSSTSLSSISATAGSNTTTTTTTITTTSGSLQQKKNKRRFWPQPSSLQAPIILLKHYSKGRMMP